MGHTDIGSTMGYVEVSKENVTGKIIRRLGLFPVRSEQMIRYFFCDFSIFSRNRELFLRCLSAVSWALLDQRSRCS